MILSSNFYSQDSIRLAQNLLGCFLLSESPEGVTGGIIVETEAYLFNDPASQSFRGKTKRNFPLFGPPGYSYVYLTYGRVFCLNITSGKEGKGEGVLIRALEPTHGIEVMRKRRKKQDIIDLCSGPGKLTQALGITIADSNIEVSKGRIKIYDPTSFKKLSLNDFKIVKATRIGISKAQDVLNRFYIKDCAFVSKF